MSSIHIKSQNFYYYFVVECDNCKKTHSVVDSLTVINGLIYCSICEKPL